MGPLVGVPTDARALARFATVGALPITTIANRFTTDAARALLTGSAAHACIRLDRPLTGALGLALVLAGHAVGWPFAVGGAQTVPDGLAAIIRENGGDIETGRTIARLGDIPPARAVLADVTPRQLLAIAGDRLAGRAGRPYRQWRYGCGACKVDLLLEAPMPWTDPACRRAGTLHLGGSAEEIVAAESAVVAGSVPERPFVLAAQPTIADPSRAPAGRHVVWAYTHVPHGSPIDASGAIERQFDRFAPGWRDLVVARAVRTAPGFEQENPNNVGGDIVGGAVDGLQVARYARRRSDPYATPLPDVWLCSASTPPGAGVHGMGGWHAAGRVLMAYGARRSVRSARAARFQPVPNRAAISR
jgi:phytoene dehydrogenase-like protein